jgi:hypothetical protein
MHCRLSLRRIGEGTVIFSSPGVRKIWVLKKAPLKAE